MLTLALRTYAGRIPFSTIEALEARIAPAALTYTVLNLKDQGPGSLSQAMAEANAHVNAEGEQDHIVFKTGLAGKMTLTKNSPDLPETPMR